MVCLKMGAAGDKKRKLDRVKELGGWAREQDAVGEWRRWYLGEDSAGRG